MKGCRHKFVVFYLFLEYDLHCLHAKFQVCGTSPLVYCPKMPKYFTFFPGKKYFCKLFVVFHQIKKDSPFFDKNSACNKSLLLKLLFSLIFIA